MVVDIRPGRPGDADGVAHVTVAAWRAAYAHLLSSEFLDALSEERSAANYRAGLEHGRTIWIAEDESVIVGFAIAGRPGPGRSGGVDDEPPRDLELALIYQLPAYHGSGSGQALLDAAIGSAPCFLWVAADNPRAQAFYRRNGFAFDGATKVEPAWEGLRESRMIR